MYCFITDSRGCPVPSATAESALSIVPDDHARPPNSPAALALAFGIWAAILSNVITVIISRKDTCGCPPRNTGT